VWGTGNFEGDDAESWLHSLCQPVLDSLRSNLADGALIQEDLGQGLVPAKLQVLAAVWEEANRTDGGTMDTPVFAFSLPSGREVRRRRRAYLTVWEAGASRWWPAADAAVARRQVIEASFDRLLGIVTGVERQRRQRVESQRRRGGG
jgi:hypothetical protein